MSLWHCICLLNIQRELCCDYKTEASAIINRQLKSELLQLQLPDWHHRAPHQLGNYRQQLERNTGQPKSVQMCRWMCVSLHMSVFDAVKLAVIISRNSKKETFINLTAVSHSLTRNQLKAQVSRRDVMFMTGLEQRMVLLSAREGILWVNDRDSVSGCESLGSMVGGWLPRDAVESLHGQL